MKAGISLFAQLAVGLVCGLTGAALAAPPAAPAKAPAGANSAATNTVAEVVAQQEIPSSVFASSENSKDGRNPFFPRSAMGRPVPKPKESGTPDVYVLVLNGITSPPKQTAMINNRTFELGEEAEVKLPNGAKTRIKCVAINGDSAVIECAGQRRELRLRSGI